MKNAEILIVDDNRSVLSALELLLQPVCKHVETTATPNQIPHLLEKKHYDVILLDMNYSAGINTGNEGLYWLRRIFEIDTDSSVIMITAYGDVDLAVRAVKEGAVDFVMKPWENGKLLATISAAVQLRNSKNEIQQLRLKEQQLKSEISKEQKTIIGSSPALRHILNIVEKVANTDANVLITGENGTGKELIARELHRLSGRRREVLVSVDMGALTETLFESELFGHTKGAFTDAKEDRVGKFEIAKGGSLFLDEIANISMPLQAKLLTTLQNREIVRVGANNKIPIDIRLICATNGDLPNLVAEGLFREDLLYRINTIKIEMPPLRERGEDIAELASFFLEKYAKKYGKPTLSIGTRTFDKLQKYEWPGNIRELQHAIEKAVIMCDGDTLKPTDFFFDSTQRKKNKQLPETLEDMEKKMIGNALLRNDYNLSITATELGITRQTLYNKIKKYKL